RRTSLPEATLTKTESFKVSQVFAKTFLCAIHASTNSAKANQGEPTQSSRRTEAAQCLQSRGCVCRRRMVVDSDRNAGSSVSGSSQLGGSACHPLDGNRFSCRADYCLGVRTYTRRNQAHRRRGGSRTTFTRSRLDRYCCHRCGAFDGAVLPGPLHSRRQNRNS